MTALSVTAANVIAVQHSVNGIAGETITAGMPVYKDSTTTPANKLKKCKADAVETANCDGIATNGAAVDQPISYVKSGVVGWGAILTVGQTYCVSDATAGQIVPISDLGSGDFVTILGVALTTANLALDIQNSATEKLA